MILGTIFKLHFFLKLYFRIQQKKYNYNKTICFCVVKCYFYNKCMIYKSNLEIVTISQLQKPLIRNAI